MPVGLRHFRAVAQLQLPPRIPSEHRVQNTAGLLAEDLQQSGICSAAVAVGEQWIRGRLRADEDVHDPDVVREGLGCGVSSPGCDLDALLDRNPSARAAPVAGQGAHPNGLSA